MKYDIVLYGASGYTGQYVVEFLVNNLKKNSSLSHLTWAAAGRNESKINGVLKRVASVFDDLNLEKTPIIICDSSDKESLEAMTRQARLVINCVGPYRFYGEQVVAACIASGTHHVDISGEPEYLEKMQMLYDKEASEKGVYIVGSCGFDSIPADLGQIFLAQTMEGDVNETETYLTVDVPNEAGPCINFATWQSAIYGFAFADALKPIRKKLYPERLPATKPKMTNRGNLHYSDIVKGWCMPFPGSDRSVMMRTQRFRHGNAGERPSQIACYMRVRNLLVAVKVMILGMIFGYLATKEWGRNLLEGYPGIFSFGGVTKEGPSKKMADNTDFKVTLVGKGWKDKAKDRTDKPDRQVRVSVSGKNIGYGATCELVVQSALTVLEESDSMPGRGGVLTPGFAFADSTIITRLTNNGVPFVVEQVKDI